MDNALAAAGTTAAEVGEDAPGGRRAWSTTALLVLGGGAILAGLVLGAIVAFIIDKRFVRGRGLLRSSARCSAFIGLIHAEQVGWNVGGQVALGYLFAGVVLLAFGLLDRRRPRRRRRRARRRGRRAGPGGQRGGGHGRRRTPATA